MATTPSVKLHRPSLLSKFFYELSLWRDYLELTKPKVVALMLITTVIGMRLATLDPIPLSLFITALFGISLSMGGAAAINHVVDHKIDTLMARTSKRPVATGKIGNTKALLFATGLCLISLLILEVFVNRLTAVLTFSGMVGYAVIYTFYLKRATPQNIVIGGLAGALPPLLGWTAVTNSTFLPIQKKVAFALYSFSCSKTHSVI